jgi:hypothetical protein
MKIYKVEINLIATEEYKVLKKENFGLFTESQFKKFIDYLSEYGDIEYRDNKYAFIPNFQLPILVFFEIVLTSVCQVPDTLDHNKIASFLSNYQKEANTLIPEKGFYDEK